jgi:hypothetical protein
VASEANKQAQRRRLNFSQIFRRANMHLNQTRSLRCWVERETRAKLDPAAFDLLIKIGVPTGTFVLGFLTSRFTMSKKERADTSRAAFQDTRLLMERQEETFQAYTAAINSYLNSLAEGEIDHFMAIATTGETYFYQLKIACDAILSGNVSEIARENTLLPKIREATLITLPEHYDALQTIAKKKGFSYHGELRRENYISLYDVIEKFGATAKWQQLEGNVSA